MNLFLLTLFPLSILIYYFQREENERAHFLLLAFIGFFTGIIFLAYKLLFSSSLFLPTANFGINFLFFLILQTILPCAIIFGLLFLFARRDSVKERFSYFYVICASFYTVFLPYTILSTEKPYAGFLIFIKPLLYLAMLIFVHKWLNKTQNVSNPTTKQKIVNILFLIFALCLPSFAETVWLLGWNFLIWLIPSILFFFLDAILLFPKTSIKD